ncbi:MAG: hypothetical protein GEU97_01125 [Actinophytocola sp.]|nr:hypothetical protein [Actinophytocola sp.]
MSKHAKRHASTRTLALIAVAVVAAVLRKPRWQRLLRDHLESLPRPGLVRPSEDHTPTRHRAADNRTLWGEITEASRGWLAVALRWAREAETSARRLLDVVGAAALSDARIEWVPGRWPRVRRDAWRRASTLPWQTNTSVGHLTGAVGAVLAVLLISSVAGQVATPPAPQTSLAVKGFRTDHVDFTRHLLNAPAATDQPPSTRRAAPAADAERSKPAAPARSRKAPQPAGTKAVPVHQQPGPVRVQPYLYLNSNHVPDIGAVMRRTGVTEFTLAFVLSNGGCQTVWDGGPRVGRNAGRVISAIRANGGDIVVSFGGWAGRKLGTHCRTPQALAAAYQQVIDTYRLRAIDVDIEHHEFENPRAQDRVLRALRLVKAANPGLTTVVTMPVARDGLNSWGLRMVRRVAELRVPVDIWTVMPFVLGVSGGDMGGLTIRAAERTHAQLARHYPGMSAADVYRKLGISTMNGDTGAGETITQADFRKIRTYVHRRGLGRFTFWAVNRDWPCPARGSRPCSGVPQRPWQFTDIVNGVPSGP